MVRKLKNRMINGIKQNNGGGQAKREQEQERELAGKNISLP